MLSETASVSQEELTNKPTAGWMEVADFYYYHYFFIVLSGVGLSPLGTAATTGLLYQPQMIDDGDCGAIGGMKIGRGNRSTRRKLTPPPHCLPHIPHDQTQARTSTAVGSQRLIAWAMARPDVANDALSNRFSCQYVEYQWTTKITSFYLLFVVLVTLIQLTRTRCHCFSVSWHSLPHLIL
jgi:hypothetical protein